MQKHCRRSTNGFSERGELGAKFGTEGTQLSVGVVDLTGRCGAVGKEAVLSGSFLLGMGDACAQSGNLGAHVGRRFLGRAALAPQLTALQGEHGSIHQRDTFAGGYGITLFHREFHDFTGGLGRNYRRGGLEYPRGIVVGGVMAGGEHTEHRRRYRADAFHRLSMCLRLYMFCISSISW